MKQQVFLQKIFHPDILSAKLGLVNLSYEIIEKETLDNLLMAYNYPVIGTCDFMKDIFTKLGVRPEFWQSNYPSELTEYYGREISLLFSCREIDLKKYHHNLVFVKPVIPVLFHAQVMERAENWRTLETNYPNEKLFAQPVLEGLLKQEWRIYVDERQILGIFPKTQITSWLPDMDWLQRIVTDCPLSTYSFDVDLCFNSPILIELNDFWALGNYGLDHNVYAKCLMKRYFEIIAHAG